MSIASKVVYRSTNNHDVVGVPGGNVSIEIVIEEIVSLQQSGAVCVLLSAGSADFDFGIMTWPSYQSAKNVSDKLRPYLNVEGRTITA
jgi:hypothetical protein